jgi:adenine-specific DNA-methyltransferase
VPPVPKAVYHYSPHLPPVLRFDPSGTADKLPALLEEAGRRPLTEKEQRLLAEALRTHEPWLEWAQKREQHQRRVLRVDPVALHIHERVSAEAIVRMAMREDVQRDLFADPQMPYQQAVQFYKHDVDWANRLILGDSLPVMASLARRENLAGKVQMIYMDPPYGIKFGSNFQPEVGNRDVKDKDADLTREAETVRAYRDTWRLGVHSYFSYLRDRLLLARELLTPSGSIFLQIGDEHMHNVRKILDEVFGVPNYLVTIVLKKRSCRSARRAFSTARRTSTSRAALRTTR